MNINVIKYGSYSGLSIYISIGKPYLVISTLCFVLEIQQQFCSNTAYLVLYLVKETCNVVVDRRVSSLLVIVINVCISPSY